jgi:hypothetical protein
MEEDLRLKERLTLEEDLALEVPASMAGVHTSYDVNTQAALWQIYPHR